MNNHDAMKNAFDYWLSNFSEKIESATKIQEVYYDEMLFAAMMSSLQFVVAAMGDDIYAHLMLGVSMYIRTYSPEELQDICEGKKNAPQH